VSADGRLPDAITIGCQKCGTTSLHRYLRAHPEIGVSRYKDTRFFAVSGDARLGETGNWHRGVDWYRRQFPRDKRVLVEGFGGLYTDYPRERGVPERIHGLIPEARFLLLVRDPIERIVSHWMHAYSNSVEHRSLDQAVTEHEDNVYLDRSRYFMQLERYLPFFEPSRFLVIDQRDLLRDRRETLARVFRFLDVEDRFWSSAFEVEHHPSARKRRNNRGGMLIQRVAGDRIIRRLRDRQRWLFKFAYVPVSAPITRPVMPAAARRRLIDALRSDVRALEEFTGRSFEHWLG
jgi:hypothetical protein